MEASYKDVFRGEVPTDADGVEAALATTQKVLNDRTGYTLRYRKAARPRLEDSGYDIVIR
jgi:hypothetical protein